MTLPETMAELTSLAALGLVVLNQRRPRQALDITLTYEQEPPMSPEVQALIPQIEALVQAKDAAEAQVAGHQAELDAASAATQAAVSQRDAVQEQLNTANNQIAALQADHTDDVTAIENALQDPPAS